MIKKYANCEILDIRSSPSRMSPVTSEGFNKLAKPEINDDGYLYVQVRAISSRVNKNEDGWPSKELASAYRTFENRPIFVDHNNENPERTRGYVKAALLHVEDVEKASSFDPYYATAPDHHKPPTWIELLLEVDAKSFPKLAHAILNEEIDAVSMGANISLSKCSVCDKEAKTPQEYCIHLKNGKGQEFEIVSSDGTKQKKRAYEDCYGVNFFEISFVFDPADSTALVQDIRAEASTKEAITPHEEEWVNGTWLDDGHYNGDNHLVHHVTDLKKCPSCKKGTLTPHHKTKLPEPNTHICDHCGFASKVGASVSDSDNDPDELDHSPRDESEYTEWTPPGHSQKVPDEEPHVRQGEDAQVYAWRLQQFEGLGFPPELATELASGKLDYHDLERLIQQGATPDLAHQIMAKKADNGNGGYALNDHSEREINYTPQSEQLTTPGDLDTLAPDKTCPRCGTELGNDKTVGADICPECNWSSKPSGLDSPDLGLHHRLLEQPKQEAQATQPPVADAAPSSFITPITPLSSQTNKVNNEMKFTTKTRFVVLSEEELSQHEAAVDKKVLNPDPKKNGSDVPKGKVISDQLAPVESTPKETTMDKESDRETIKRVEEDGQGVKRTEEIIREHGPMGDAEPSVDTTDAVTPDEGATEGTDPLADPTTDVKPEPTSDLQPPKEEDEYRHSSESHLFAALKLAKLATEIGLITSDNELVFVAEMENESAESIKARMATLELVKNAGLSKKRLVTSRRGFPTMPKMAATLTTEDDVPFEALFL